MINETLLGELRHLQGKTIAVVYIYENENAAGFGHYHVWKSDVISGWLKAIQAIHCQPYILDVRTFVEKAVNRSLPSIDYVLNLNCGSENLSAMGLVPSVCSFLDIPCIPCSTGSIIAGEDKYIANLIALARGMNTPKEVNADDPSGIYRPLNCGSSVGVRRGVCNGRYREGTYQEFITGYDLTTPLIYSPVSEEMLLMPGVLILPKSEDPEWFYGEVENKTESGFYKQIAPPFSIELQQLYRDIVRAFAIKTYCRIDARIKCDNKKQLKEMLDEPLAPKNVYFLEVNPMPSIRTFNNDFLYSYNNLPPDGEICQVIDTIGSLWQDTSLNTVLLVCSMLSEFKARCRK